MAVKKGQHSVPWCGFEPPTDGLVITVYGTAVATATAATVRVIVLRRPPSLAWDAARWVGCKCAVSAVVAASCWRVRTDSITVTAFELLVLALQAAAAAADHASDPEGRTGAAKKRSRVWEVSFCFKMVCVGEADFDLYKIHPPKEEAKAIDFG
jgi:hypothetical protein